MALSKFDEKCVELLADAPKRHSRNCFRSAFNHLECARKIAEIDPAMAIFRAITAEEEAASGLMYCLKEQNYRNSDKLKPKDHVHKNSVIPFLEIISKFHNGYLKEYGIKPRFEIRTEQTERRLMIGVPVSTDGQSFYVNPTPPLNLGVSVDEQAPSYRKKIADYVSLKGSKDIVTHLKNEANKRNQLLYASEKGYPVVKDVNTDFFALKQRNIVVLLKAYLFIFPYSEIQPFVQQNLDAYLAMLGTLKEHDLNIDL
jgi:hypothetical protein